MTPAVASWLQLYLEWTKALEAPTIFHRWCAVQGVAHVLGRRVWMHRGGKYAIFPAQISVVLVGDSAKVRKGIAMRQILALLGALPTPVVNILPEKTSPQELLPALKPRDEEGNAIEDVPAVGLIVAEELGAFFSREGFLETMATHVTRLLDAPHGLVELDAEGRPALRSVVKEYKFRSWNVTLVDPCAQVFGGITPSGIAEELPAVARTAGFFGRLFWPYADRTDRKPNPLTVFEEKNLAMQQALLTGLESMALLSGHVWFTKEGREWYEEWYTTVHCPAVEGIDGSVVQETGFLGRKGDHLLRVAIVLAACRHVVGGGKFVVMRGDLVEALRMLEELERNMPAAMREVGNARESAPVRHTLALLERWPQGITRQQLLSKLWRKGIKAQSLDRDVMPTLMEAGIVAETRTKSGERVYVKVLKAGERIRRGKEAVVDRVVGGG